MRPPLIVALAGGAIALVGCGDDAPAPAAAPPPAALAQVCSDHAQALNAALIDLGEDEPTADEIDALERAQAKLVNAARRSEGDRAARIIDYSLQGQAALDRLPGEWAKSRPAGQRGQSVAMRAGNAIVAVCMAELEDELG